MTFHDLSKLIRTKRLDNYNRLLLEHHDVIINEVGKTSKTEVAIELNMPKSIFTTAYRYILAYNDIKTS